jgi:hypothetical protein
MTPTNSSQYKIIQPNNSLKFREAWRVNGRLVKVFVRCGKKDCHCKKSVKHGPYWNLIWTERFVNKRRYIRKDKLDSVRAALKRGRAWADNARKRREQLKTDLVTSLAYLNGVVSGEAIEQSQLEISAKALHDFFSIDKLERFSKWYGIVPDHRGSCVCDGWCS